MLAETSIIQTLKDEPQEWRRSYVACGDDGLEESVY